MKKLLLLQLLYCFVPAVTAQQKFTGTIEYKITLFKDMPGYVQPVKVIMAYGQYKMCMRASYADNPDEFVLVNTLTDSIYISNRGTSTYTKQSLSRKGAAGLQLLPTDSFKTYFGYRCRGYRLQVETAKANYGYVWLAGDLYGITPNEHYQHDMYKLTGAPYVMFSSDMYADSERLGIYIPVDVKKMDEVPQSYFDITGYTETKWDDADSKWDVHDTAKLSAPEIYTQADTAIKVDAGKPMPAKKTVPVKKPASKPKTAALKPKN